MNPLRGVKAKAVKIDKRFARGGLYLEVVLKDGKLYGVDIGRTRSTAMRFCEYMADMAMNKTRRPWHKAGRQEDCQVMVFPLYLQSKHDSVTASTHRAIIEALYCILLGSYCRSQPLLKVRVRVSFYSTTRS